MSVVLDCEGRRRAAEFDTSHLQAISPSYSMKILLFLPALAFLLLLFYPPQTNADLKSDKQALLNFSAMVPHSRKLNWKSFTSVCTSWIGITCNGSHVLAVRLPGIGLYGHVPANTLGKLDGLMTLSLRSNFLTGDLPSDILSLPSLQYVYLQHNNFSGTIPSSLSPMLNSVDLSFNFFTGDIPPTLRKLTNLTSLNLQKNSLSGFIPELNTSVLKQLNLSFNHLNGSIPSAFQKFPSSSFAGNNMLCGPPLNHCSVITPSPSPAPPFLSPSPVSPQQPRVGSKKKLSTGAIIAIAIGGSVLPLGLFLVTVICCLKKKVGEENSVLKGKVGRGEKPKEDFGSGIQDSEKNKLVFFEGSSYNFDLEDLLRASAEVLGKGSYGTTYKAILEEGTMVVVKRLKDVVTGKREFDQQMELVGTLGQHPNVIPLRAYYYSKDEKLLVYDYSSAGSFFTLLHGNSSLGRNPLDWESRVKICLETARGIAHIHSASGGKLIHGNVKSSNVLIAQELGGCISDFGLIPTIMSYPAVPSRNAGYRAPEVVETRKPIQKSDVYSFGVLLLEMLTGKAPVQMTGQDDVVDLPRWVQSVVREEWTAEVFDIELMRYQNIEEEMVEMLQVAMACVARVPEMRPTMDEVVTMIEEIRSSDSVNQLSSEENKELDTSTPSPICL
ncbi:probable inactive receptor kinase At5g58300 isoform X2 [Mercurialis annua]|uniref:probable inactive receptor kinase At5g58300 isoform X2 n=1 Tax=Mercurialis annua TaxID=3986 RepID=UPI00215F2D7C|nr:probable inactive receptor kinase At5g58300 isoform X2 [Mercurialis annua]